MATKTNILIGYFSKGETSGIDRYLSGVVTKANRNEQNIDILSRNCGPKTEKFLSDNHCGLFKIPRSRHFLKQFFSIARIIKRNRYDVAYFNISESYDCIGLLAAKICGAKSIIVHSHSSSSSGKRFSRWLKNILNLLCKPILYFTADYYYACSDKAAKWLFPHRIFATKSYRIIANAIDFSSFDYSNEKRQQARSKIYERHNIPNGATVLGHIGRFEYQKNNLFLIDILAKIHESHPNTYLICIGDHNDEFKKFQSYAKQKGLSNFIITPGIVDDAPDYYQAFDIFLLPSNREGLPVVAIEAQASRIPCILSNTIDQSVKISPNTFFLPINDASIWANKIIKITSESNSQKTATLLSRAKEYDLRSNTSFSGLFNLDPQKSQKSYHLAIYLFFSVHYLLNLTNLLNGLHVFLFPGVACILLACLYRLTHRVSNKSLLKDPLCRLLLAFYLSYLVTAVFTAHYNIIGLAKTAIWTAFYIFFAFSYKLQHSINNINYEVRHFLILTVLLVSLVNFFNLMLLIAGTKTSIVSLLGSNILIGYAPWGRFYGLFYDPNYASVICVCCIIFSIFLARQSKHISSKIAYLFAIALELTYILAGQSRTGYVALGIGLACYGILAVANKTLKSIPKKRIVIGVFFAIAAILLPLFFIKLPAITHQSSQSAIPTEATSTKLESDQKENIEQSSGAIVSTPILGRTDNQGDISNRRFDIWKSGIEIFSYSETNKLLGVGHSNVVSYAKDRLPKTYIVNNSFQDFDAFHNTLIDLLVSQGLLGVLIVFAIIAYLIYLIVKNRDVFRKYPLTLPLFASLLAIIASSMFVSEILYINNFNTFIFWVLLGYYYYYLKINNKEERHNS